jgi:hypothetical protein
MMLEQSAVGRNQSAVRPIAGVRSARVPIAYNLACNLQSTIYNLQLY